MDYLDDLRKRFGWKAEKIDGWRILNAPQGYLIGDCDDFALTALWIMSGRSLWRMWFNILTFRAAIWYCISERGNGHTALWMKGHGWIDNMYPHWRYKMRHKKVFPFTAPHMLLKIAIGKITKP